MKFGKEKMERATQPDSNRKSKKSGREEKPKTHAPQKALRIGQQAAEVLGVKSGGWAAALEDYAGTAEERVSFTILPSKRCTVRSA
jgi:hypothetical protein